MSAVHTAIYRNFSLKLYTNKGKAMTMALLLFLLTLLLITCRPPEKNGQALQKGKVSIDLQNKQVQHLYELRDQGKIDSLVSYLNHSEATLRYISAMAFAGNRDSTRINELAKLLQDPVEEVRIMAAFALGQIGSPKCEKPLINAFISGDSLSEHQMFNSIILEAIGKCGSLTSLKNIAGISTYETSDTLLLLGQCRSIYNYMLRKLTDPAATDRMVKMVANDRIPVPARLMAANYLAKAEGISPDSTQMLQIAAGFVRAANQPDIRMALAKAMGKAVDGTAFNTLSRDIKTEKDWRVRCNMINALARYPYDTVRAIVSPLVFDTNKHVSHTAARFFIANGQLQDADYYWRIAEKNRNLPVTSQIALYHASNRLLTGQTRPESKDYVNYRIHELYQQAQTPYEKADCLAAAAEYGWQYIWIHDKGTRDPHPAVRSAAAAALLKIMRKPNFYAAFGEGAKEVRRNLYNYLREIGNSGDPGMIAEAIEGFRVRDLAYKGMRDSTRIDDLKNTLHNKLKLPQDYEAYEKLDSTIAFLEERPFSPKLRLNWNHPIDWQRLNNVSAKTEITLQTARGTIVMELYPEWAPNTVATFINLCQTNFYNGKNFHRIVPNFVAQGGCPRGDGYGAQDFSLRSEIGLVWYEAEGYVGMASAGKDTEGTQFFITHSPTPHLSGRYTIFGKVKKGMDVVYKLQPGDLIEKTTVSF